MKNTSYAVLFICVACAAFLLPREPAEAQSSRERWSRSYEGEGVDYDDLRRRRQESSELRRQIDRLDDDIVERLFVPILFGVSLNDITPNFGDPRGDGTRTHEGLDMLAPEGTPIVSPTEAVVIRVSNGTNSGLYVSTANPGDETFVYMHLSEVAEIEEGDVLEAGDLIGYVGNTGNASGGPAHLHFEIHEDNTVKDPYFRISEEFSLEEKMGFLEVILDDHDDKNDLAEFLIEEFQPIFIQARTNGIALPDAIADALPAEALVTTVGRDLTVGSQGADVSALQSRLIAGEYLALDAPTGYFGALTEAALRAYQTGNGISPASGYYGPVTRAHMSTEGSSAPAVEGELTLETLIRLLVALEIIPQEKEEAALDALAALNDV